MNTELTPMQTFEEQVKERLKTDIADLLPDEALSGLIEKSINEMFFKPRITGNSFNERREPSWFNQAVETAVKARLSGLLTKHLADHQKDIDAKIEASIVRSMPAAVETLTMALHELVEHIKQMSYR